jgi:hypothetical protein
MMIAPPPCLRMTGMATCSRGSGAGVDPLIVITRQCSSLPRACGYDARVLMSTSTPPQFWRQSDGLFPASSQVTSREEQAFPP